MTKEILQSYADEVAEGFLANSTPLDQSISEMSKNNDLNIEQIKRLCEMANTIVQNRLYPVDPLMQFEVADSNKVIKSLNQSEESICEPDVIPTSTSPDLVTEFMKKYGPPMDTEGPRVKQIIIIQIKKVARELDKKDQEIKVRQFELEKESKQIDLELSHMVKLAMNDGTFPALIKASYEILDKPGMEYIFEKIAYWKEKKVLCNEPVKIAGNLNKKHPFVEKLNKLAENKAELLKIAIKRKTIEISKKKLYDIEKEKKTTIKAKDIIEEPKITSYKQT